MVEQTSPKPVSDSSSKVKTIFIVLTVIFFVLSAILATSLILKNKSYATLQKENKTLSDAVKAQSATEKADNVATEKEKSSLEKSQATAETELAKEKAGEAKAQQYNNLLGFISDKILERGKLQDFTETDFEDAKVRAENIKDPELTALIEEKWNDHSVDPSVNVFSVISYIQNKIEENIKQ